MSLFISKDEESEKEANGETLLENEQELSNDMYLEENNDYIPPQSEKRDDGLSGKLNDIFAGKIVRKDLTKKIKEGANVPVYVLEYLLGMYCATSDENSIADGMNTVKNILAENFVRPDEAEKIKARMREFGTFTIIDKVEAKLNASTDLYQASFMNLRIGNVIMADEYIKKYEKLLCGGIWCILKMLSLIHI